MVMKSTVKSKNSATDKKTTLGPNVTVFLQDQEKNSLQPHTARNTALYIRRENQEYSILYFSGGIHPWLEKKGVNSCINNNEQHPRVIVFLGDKVIEIFSHIISCTLSTSHPQFPFLSFAFRFAAFCFTAGVFSYSHGRGCS